MLKETNDTAAWLLMAGRTGKEGEHKWPKKFLTERSLN